LNLKAASEFNLNAWEFLPLIQFKTKLKRLRAFPANALLTQIILKYFNQFLFIFSGAQVKNISFYQFFEILRIFID
jgi:hypothetical protein